MIDNNKPPYAIIIGLDTMQGIQAARILNRRKVPVIAIADDPNHYCCRTNVCDEILFANTGNIEFIEKLLELKSKLTQKAVLFPCNDTSVSVLSQNRQKLEDAYHLILPEGDMVELMMDKVQFYSYSIKENLPIPPTYILKNRQELDKIIDEVDFPCIIKPPNSNTELWEKNSKLKAYKISNSDDLINIYEQCKNWSDILILQKYITSPIRNLYSCNCYFNSESVPLVTFVARKLRQWPPETGESCLGEECENDEVLNQTIKIFKNVNYRGLGYIEFRQDEKDKKYYIIEPNIGRPTGRSAISEGGGIELLYTMYCDVLGLTVPKNQKQIHNGVKWIFLRRDLQSALYHWRKGELTFWQWIKSVHGRKIFAIFSWKDPAPFFGDIYRSIRLFLVKNEREKRNYYKVFPK